MLFAFYYSKKCMKETVLSFVLKIKLNVQEHLKCWLWRLMSLLWAEYKFSCGITSLRKAEQIIMTMLILVAHVTLITDENTEAVKKMILDNRRISIRKVSDDFGISLGSCQVICTYILGTFHAAEK